MENVQNCYYKVLLCKLLAVMLISPVSNMLQLFSAIASCITLELTIFSFTAILFYLKILIHEMGKSCQTTQDVPGLTVHFLFQCTTMVQETNTKN